MDPFNRPHPPTRRLKLIHRSLDFNIPLSYKTITLIFNTSKDSGNSDTLQLIQQSSTSILEKRN